MVAGCCRKKKNDGSKTNEQLHTTLIKIQKKIEKVSKIVFFAQNFTNLA